jgi:hypothetical protein
MREMAARWKQLDNLRRQSYVVKAAADQQRYDAAMAALKQKEDDARKSERTPRSDCRARKAIENALILDLRGDRTASSSSCIFSRLAITLQYQLCVLQQQNGVLRNACAALTSKLQ